MPVQIETWNAAKLEPVSFPEDARLDSVCLAPSLSLTKGTLLGKITSTGRLAAYNDALATGVEVAVAILQHDVSTDASGNHYLGTSAVASSMNLPQASTPAYVAGVFDITELTGWNAAAAADLHARILPSGHYRIP